MQNRSDKKTLKEVTSVSNIPVTKGVISGPAGNMPCGTPYFKCSEDEFFGLHMKARRNPGQWYKKYYGSDIGEWCRQKCNRKKDFYLQWNNMNRKIKNW